MSIQNLAHFTFAFRSSPSIRCQHWTSRNTGHLAVLTFQIPLWFQKFFLMCLLKLLRIPVSRFREICSNTGIWLKSRGNESVLWGVWTRFHWFYMHNVHFAEQQDQVPPAPPCEPETACSTLLRQSTSHYILRLLFVSDGWLLCWTWGINLPTVFMCFWPIHKFVGEWK